MEGKSQAGKDHAADQETVAAPSLEYLPKGKTQRRGPSEPHTEMYGRKRPARALGRFSSRAEDRPPTDRNVGSRNMLALFQGHGSGGDGTPAL